MKRRRGRWGRDVKRRRRKGRKRDWRIKIFEIENRIRGEGGNESMR